MLLDTNTIIKEVKNKIQYATPEKIFANESSKAATIIDVREPNEFSKKSLTNAINIPRGLLEMQIQNFCKTADTPILVHCAAGARACLAAEQLQRLGYKDVTAIEGRFEDIYQAQLKSE